MDYDFFKLKQAYSEYYNGYIAEDDFNTFIGRVYYDILQGGFIEVKKLITYPIISMILKLSDEEYRIEDREKEKKYVYEILEGRKNIVFNVEISFPIEMYDICKKNSFFDPLRRIKFKNFYNDLLMCKNNITQQQCVLHYLPIFENLNEIDNTIFQIIEKYIIMIMKSICYEGSIGKSELKIFPNRLATNSVQDILLNYLRCYIGIQSFQCIINIEKEQQKFRLLV